MRENSSAVGAEFNTLPSRPLHPELVLDTIQFPFGGWPMMNEWGIPPVHLDSLVYRYVRHVAQRGEYVPALAVAGGFVFEDQIFTGLASGAPFVKLVGMARAPIAAAMVGKTTGRGLFLPPGSLTGFPGINVGGISGAENQSASMIFIFMVAVVAVFQMVIFKKKWL
jgi:hypothetical protein